MKLPLSILLLVCQLTYGQKNEISLLNGRFFFTFPDSAKNIARGADIMSAGPNMNDETRVIYDIGDKRAVFFAQELYITCKDELEKKITAESTSDYPLSIKTIYNKDSILCVSMTPSKFDNRKSAILVNSMIVKNADNSLSKLSVYLNPKAYEDKATFDKITEKVFSSFRKGNRRLPLFARTETFNVLGTKTKLELKMPSDYIVIIDKKYDFEVYRIKKITDYSEEDRADLNIYFGFHPSYFNTELELTKFKQPDTDGEFMFQKIKWMNFRDDSRSIIVREQMFTDDDIQKDAAIHIAMVSTTPKLIEEMTAIVRQVLLKYDK